MSALYDDVQMDQWTARNKESFEKISIAEYITVYAIIFAYRYFRDFGLGAEIRKGLILQFCWCFHYYKYT